MPRFRTVTATTLLVVPIVAGHFLPHNPRSKVNEGLFGQVLGPELGRRAAP